MSTSAWDALVSNSAAASTVAAGAQNGWWSMAWGPAPINWCEHDYATHSGIAEFWNTISNFGLVVVGLYGFVLVRRHKLPIQYGAFAASIFLTGVFSAMFHATLYWIGQKLDEAFENLILVTMFHIEGGNILLSMAHAILAVVGIFCITSFLFCELHLITMVLITLRRFAQSSSRLPQLAPHVAKAAAFAAIGFGCWLVDRLACDIVGQVPQLHAWWHMMVSAALYQSYMCSVALYLLAPLQATMTNAQVVTALATLRHEHMILDRIIYRNHNQHRRTLYYQRMRGVARLLPKVMETLSAANGKQAPSAIVAASAIHSVTELWVAVLKCVRHVMELISGTYFLPLAISVLALLARVVAVLRFMLPWLIRMVRDRSHVTKQSAAANTQENKDALEAVTQLETAMAHGNEIEHILEKSGVSHLFDICKGDDGDAIAIAAAAAQRHNKRASLPSTSPTPRSDTPTNNNGGDTSPPSSPDNGPMIAPLAIITDAPSISTFSFLGPSAVSSSSITAATATAPSAPPAKKGKNKKQSKESPTDARNALMAMVGKLRDNVPLSPSPAPPPKLTAAQRAIVKGLDSLPPTVPIASPHIPSSARATARITAPVVASEATAARKRKQPLPPVTAVTTIDDDKNGAAATAEEDGFLSFSATTAVARKRKQPSPPVTITIDDTKDDDDGFLSFAPKPKVAATPATVAASMITTTAAAEPVSANQRKKQRKQQQLAQQQPPSSSLQTVAVAPSVAAPSPPPPQSAPAKKNKKNNNNATTATRPSSSPPPLATAAVATVRPISSMLQRLVGSGSVPSPPPQSQSQQQKGKKTSGKSSAAAPVLPIAAAVPVVAAKKQNSKTATAAAAPQSAKANGNKKNNNKPKQSAAAATKSSIDMDTSEIDKLFG